MAGVLGTFPYDLKMAEYRAKIGGFIGASGSEIATLLNTGAVRTPWHSESIGDRATK